MRAALGLCLIAMAGCGEDTCDPMEEACVIEGVVSTFEIEAGVEDEDMCQSWTLDNPTELWVNSIGQRNGGAYHHANWFFVPDDEYPVPDGAWRCSEHGFSEVGAALLGGYLFALSTQSTTETQALPPGSAIRIPPYSRVIGASHLLNAGDQKVTTTMELQLHTVPPPEVKAKMAPARISYHELSLDPQAKSSFTTECLFDDAYQTIFETPLQYELHYALAHYHNLGVYAQLEIAGGPRDGEVIMRHEGYGENFGRAFDPPLELGSIGARGVRFTCGYVNPRDQMVGWGIGDQEMCVIALQARTDLAWDASVSSNDTRVIAPDNEIKYGGACGLTAFPWNHEKQGGPPR